MPYQLTIEERPTYLHAKVEGTHHERNARRFLDEVREACVRRNCSAVLLEMNFSGPSLDSSAIFAVIAQQTEFGRRMRKVAYVDASTERSPKQMKFAETVAANRGVNVRLFHSLEEAQRWMSDASTG